MLFVRKGQIKGVFLGNTIAIIKVETRIELISFDRRHVQIAQGKAGSCMFVLRRKDVAVDRR